MVRFRTHTPSIRIPVRWALMVALVILSLLPLGLIQGIINEKARETVEGEVLRLTQGIFNNAREAFNQHIENCAQVFTRGADRSALIKLMLQAKDRQVVTLPESLIRGQISVGQIVLIPLDSGQPVRQLVVEDSSAGPARNARLAILPPLVRTGSDTLSVIRENRDKLLWLGHVPFYQGLSRGFWAVGLVGLSDTASAVLCVSLNQSLLDKFLSRLSLDTNSAVRLVCSDNTVLPDGDANFFNQPFAAQAMSRINTGVFSFFAGLEQYNDQLRPVLVHVYADPNYLYNLVAVTPRDALTASLSLAISQARGYLLVTAVLILVVALIFIYFINRRFSTIKSLMNRIAMRDFSFSRNDVPLGLSEVEQIYEGIMQMSDQLRQILRSLESSQDELEGKVAERTAALEQALANQIQLRDFILQNEKMASLGRTVAGFTHELNTPLGVCHTAVSQFSTSIQSLRGHFLANTLSTRIFQETLDSFAEITLMIERNLAEAIRITGSLKHVAIDQSRVERRNYDLGEYLGEVISSLSPRLHHRPWTVSLHCPEKVFLYGDPAVFYQILGNLINNSIDHGFKGRTQGSIGIQVERDAVDFNQVVLEYSDDGNGMNPEQLQRIYEPYFTTGKEYGGSGLGMAIVRNLVESELSGTIECGSSPGQGTHFRICFPIKVA